MVISKDKVVSVNYHLSVKDTPDSQERFVEKTDASNPLVFLFGSGNLLEAFEKNLKGKKAGDNFDFHLAAKDGYGEWQKEHVVNIPVEAFKGEDGKIDNEMLSIGNMLPMVDQQGNRLQGTVKEVTDTLVTMDFNHPMAGQELHFVGEVLEVRDASADEISHGHVHGPGGHHHH